MWLKLTLCRINNGSFHSSRHPYRPYLSDQSCKTILNPGKLLKFPLSMITDDILFLFFIHFWSSYIRNKPSTLTRISNKRGAHKSEMKSDDYFNASSHIFTPFPRRKHIFSLVFSRKLPRRHHSIPDCCKRLIRLIRFFSDGACC